MRKSTCKSDSSVSTEELRSFTRDAPSMSPSVSLLQSSNAAAASLPWKNKAVHYFVMWDKCSQWEM